MLFTSLSVFSPLHRFVWDQHSDQFPVGLLAQLVEHCTSIAEVMGSNLVQALIFFPGPLLTTEVVFITVKIAIIFTSYLQFKYMTFIYSQPFIHHFMGLFGTNTVTSSQLACQLSCQSTAPLSQRSWVQIPYRPEFFSGLLFTTA